MAPFFPPEGCIICLAGIGFFFHLFLTVSGLATLFLVSFVLGGVLKVPCFLGV